ncbi:MAG: hypothetical protein ACPGO3_01890 [Magnetospiraceae bacterium]
MPVKKTPVSKVIIKTIQGVFILLVLLFAVAFTIANGESVAVDFWPLPIIEEVPFYLPVLTALLIGLLVGSFLAGIGMVKWANRAQRQKKVIDAGVRREKALQEQVAALEAKLRAQQSRGEMLALPPADAA